MSEDLIANKFDCSIDGKKVSLYTLVNCNGVKIDITNYGGRLITINLPDKYGIFKDVILGYDSITEYIYDDAYMGAIVGRYADVINGGKFVLNKKKYQLKKNFGNHAIHGGENGFDKVVWDVESSDGQSLKLHYLSNDGEENYPGNMNVWVTYSLDNDNKLRLDFLAESDSDTILNLTSHPYFNLSGHDSGTILNHLLKIDAQMYATINNSFIPKGELRGVENSPFDFRNPKIIGTSICDNDEQLKNADGYDHSFYLTRDDRELKLAASLTDNISGRNLNVFTTEPALHIYTSNCLDTSARKGKQGATYRRRDAICLEAQHFPDSPNNEVFPSTVLKAREKFSSSIIYQFGLKD